MQTKSPHNPFRAMLGDSLVTGAGQRVPIDDALLGKKIVLLYFSASWCPPCRQFTPRLVAFYNEMRAAGRSVEVVFVSADRDAASFRDYLRGHHGPWYAIPWEREQNRNGCSSFFQVQGIPRLIAFSGSTGAVVCQNAVGVPLTAATFNNWVASAWA